jgi:hypothetical protein
LVAFPAGAQAVTGQASPKKDGAARTRLAPSHHANIRISPAGRHTRDAGDPEDDFLTPFFINDEGTALPKNGEDVFNNVAATVQNTAVDPGQTNDIWQPVDSGSGVTEAAFCNANGSVSFGSTVWYILFPHRNGQFRVVVQSDSSGYRPTVNVFSVNLNTGLPTGGNSYSDSNCATSDNLFFRADLTYFDPQNNRAFLTGGKAYVIQVGGETTAGVPTGTEGDYTLDYVYDPDTDRDGLFDSQDSCDGAPGGPNGINGCPDGDNDNVIDQNDRCPTVFGTFSRGCPDADHDGNAEGINDACPGRPNVKDANDDGCQDILLFEFEPRLPYKVLFSLRGRRFVRNGFKITSNLKVSGLPRGAVVRLKCSKKRICRRVRKKRTAGSSGRVSFKLKKKKLRPRQSISIRATFPGYATRYISWKAKKRGKKGYTRKVRCIQPGTSKLIRCSKIDIFRR